MNFKYCEKCVNKEDCHMNQWCVTMDRGRQIDGKYICDNFKTADDLFKELGYEKEEIILDSENIIDTIRYVKRTKEDIYMDVFKEIEINNPEIYSYPFVRLIKIINEIPSSVDLSMEEINAINKKIEELKINKWNV